MAATYAESWAQPVKHWWGQAGQNMPNLNPANAFYPQQHQYAQIYDQSYPLQNASPDMGPEYQPYATYKHYPNVQVTSVDDQMRLRKFEKVRRACKMVISVNNILTSILTLVTGGAMAYMMYTFYMTRNVSAGNRTSPWPKVTVLWPTFLLAGASLLTLIFAVAMFVAICYRSKRKTMFNLLHAAVQITIWIATTLLYRIFKRDDDLWGWSCGSVADSIQTLYAGKLDFDIMCKLQTGSWYVSIAETITKIFFTCVAMYYHSKQKGLKRDLISTIGEAAVDNFLES